MKRYALAVGCGICAALALPPFFYLPLVVIAFCGFYILLAGAATLKQAFWLGWSFGFAHHAVGLYWISNALLTDPERFAWMIPFALSLIPAALAIYIGVIAVIYKKYIREHAFTLFGVVLFASLWVAAEWLRAHLFTGFPWNLIGYALNIHPVSMQAASIVGIYGLSFALVLAATAPVLLRQKQWIAAGCCSLLLPLLMVGFGAYRLDHAQNTDTAIPIRIVQPNIFQHHKWDEARMMGNLFTHLRLSKNAPPGSIIVWPETAVPYFLHEQGQLKTLIKQTLGDHTLIRCV